MEIKEFLEQFNIDKNEAFEFLISNNWFDKRPEKKNGKIILTEEQQNLFKEKLESYSNTSGTEDAFEKFQNKFPETAKILKRFFKDTRPPEDSKFYLIDFLYTYLNKDIILYNNTEIEELLNIAASELIFAHSETLTFFLGYVRKRRKTRYSKNYSVASKKMEDNDAYSFDEYIDILYHLFNEKYIEENEMYKKAAQSKNYADTWLFLSMHFICSLRMTDLERIYHPVLPKDAKTVLSEIENGTFSDVDALKVLLSITRKLCMLPLKPNKTKNSSNVSNIKFIVPHSCEVHIGTLFALAEAHQQVSGKTGPIIRKIASFEAISRNMGDEIGSLFIQSNFHSRRANKSFLQAIENLTGEVLGENDELNVKGYILAALARSHKASYGKFASTAATYLRDEALSGITPKFIAFELFERGVLSCIPSMLLNIMTGGEYKKLEVQKQTKFVKDLGLTPNEVEKVVAVIDESNQKAYKALMTAMTEEIPIYEVLHNIGSGSAFSKQPECLCLLSAVYKNCPYENRQCIGCDYEISTKATMFHIAAEYKRMIDIYKASKNPKEKQKYEVFVKQLLIPKLEELLQQIKNTYGDKVYKEYEQIAKEYVK